MKTPVALPDQCRNFRKPVSPAGAWGLSGRSFSERIHQDATAAISDYHLKKEDRK